MQTKDTQNIDWPSREHKESHYPVLSLLSIDWQKIMIEFKSDITNSFLELTHSRKSSTCS